MSARTAAFDRTLRAIAVPALAPHGFRFDGRRTFRRVSDDGRVCRIVNFQLGQRSMEGKFTANLAVFVDGDAADIAPDRAHESDCRWDRRTRIGALMPQRFPRLIGLPFVGFLFGTRDTWWPFSDDEARAAAAVASAVEAIAAHGLDWLAARAD